MAIHFVDHVFSLVAYEIGYIIFWYIKREHDRNGIMAQIVKAVMMDACALNEPFKTVADNIGAYGDIIVFIGVDFLIAGKCF